MKVLNVKQNGFFDPVFGLTLLAIFGLTGVAVNSAHYTNSADESRAQHQVACIETDATIVREDFHCI